MGVVVVVVVVVEVVVVDSAVVSAAAALMFQVFVNVGMTIGIMPITGIPLPFLSYGGSFLLVNLMAVAMVQRVAAEAGGERDRS